MYKDKCQDQRQRKKEKESEIRERWLNALERWHGIGNATELTGNIRDILETSMIFIVSTFVDVRCSCLKNNFITVRTFPYLLDRLFHLLPQNYHSA